MANCLQFGKESYVNEGNSGTSKTRALVCELLAIKLLKEFSTRELIDALSYDFDPLQGQSPSLTVTGNVGSNWDLPKLARGQPRVTRISTLEVAIRAQAKRFLAQILVVRHLEAIWAGKIVFHSAADSLHRLQPSIVPNQNRGYGTISGHPILKASTSMLQPAKQREHHEPIPVWTRRSVTLYNPRDASLLKLSRLRVPRYRQILSTCSLALLLALYVAVLAQRSLNITALEVVFWVWSAGFMLDEIVGFNEQGFSLYLMSFWNTFDLGILLIFMIFYGMRIFGVFIHDSRRRQEVSGQAYDILAANAILLFPRLFSVLDHYRYFSQLLIAFRLMVMDLLAVMLLIVIGSSGFFVAFTLAFGNDGYDPLKIAYALFQMVMGFTPAAWTLWGEYDVLGRTILTIFLFMCQFLIVTILISVLTNSFTAIVANANEEHQFLFAVNTISMVKSDALFSYVAPTNILAWLLTPLRSVFPFRQYVKINRTVIKITHFPILFAIYLYERIFLRRASFEPTDLIDGETMNRGRTSGHLAGPINRAVSIFSPTTKLRQGSVASGHKDRALEAVFRRPFRNGVRGPTRNSNAVDSWMQGMGSDGRASPPMEQDHVVVDRLEARRPTIRRSQILRRRQGSRQRDFTNRSIASDPEEFTSNGDNQKQRFGNIGSNVAEMSIDEMIMKTDGEADGDDELAIHDDKDDFPLSSGLMKEHSLTQEPEDYFEQKPTNKSPMLLPGPSLLASSLKRRQAKAYSRLPIPPEDVGRRHSRNISDITVLHMPINNEETSSSSPHKRAFPVKKKTPISSAGGSPRKFQKRSPPRSTPVGAPGARPIYPNRTTFQSAPYIKPFSPNGRQRKHRNSSLAMDLNSDISEYLTMQNNTVGGMPSSFATQMALATGALGMTAGGEDDTRMMSRLVLARMKTLEESFAEVLSEIKRIRIGERGYTENEVVGKEETRVPKTREMTKREKRATSHERIETLRTEVNKSMDSPKGSSI